MSASLPEPGTDAVHVPRPGQDVIIFGFGRSGTTWLAQVLARAGMEMIFEPLFPREVPELKECKSPYGDLSLFWHLERGDELPREDLVLRALRGEIRNDWTIREKSAAPPARKVVKVIRANLMADWVLDRLPMNPLFVIRNPLSVVTSALREGWYRNRTGFRCPRDLPLLTGPLAEFRYHILGPLDPLEILTTAWCINHFVPRQRGLFERLPCLVYDDLVRDPVEGFRDLGRRLYFELDAAAERQIEERSFTTAAASRAKGYSPSTGWKKHLPVGEARRIVAIVERFGLAEYLVD